MAGRFSMASRTALVDFVQIQVSQDRREARPTVVVLASQKGNKETLIIG